jgi:hypothetical protein
MKNTETLNIEKRKNIHPTLYGAAMIRKQILLPIEHIAWIEKQGIPLSAYIRKLIEKDIAT